MTKFSEMARKWQLEYREQIAYYTYSSYLAPLKDVNKAFGESDIACITPSEVKTFIDGLAAAGKSRQTVNLRLIVFNHVFRTAIINGAVISNPAAFIKLPRNLPKGTRNLPPDSDIERVRSACTDMAFINIDNLFLLLAKCVLGFGCRRGEMLAVSKYDFDFSKNQLIINKQVEFHHNRPVIKEKTKTQAGNRTIIIPEILVADLKKLCQMRSNYLFTDDNNCLFSASQVRSSWERLKLNDTTMHQFRHAYATMLYEAGVDEKTAQQMMGHASITTMRNIYTHVRESQLQKAAGQINNFLQAGA